MASDTNIRMSTLGLDGRPAREGNLFQRLFWPSAEPSEVDTLGRQGFWLCFAIGCFSFLVSAAQSRPIEGLLTLLFFVLAGIGVREHSVTAAIYVASAYLINILSALALGIPPGALDLIAFGLLAANIRGTWIASRWQKRGDKDTFPDRMSETFMDRLSDRMPARVWPKVSIAFYIFGGLFLLAMVIGSVVIVKRAHARAEQPLNIELKGIEN